MHPFMRERVSIGQLFEDFVIRAGGICHPVFRIVVEWIVGDEASPMKIGGQDKVVTLGPVNYGFSLWLTRTRCDGSIVLEIIQ